MGVTLRDFMTSGDVLTVPAETSLREAARVMRDRNVGAAVVVDGGRIAGIFTERDLLRAVADGEQPDGGRVESYMTPDPMTLPSDHAPSEAAQIMSERRFRHIPWSTTASWWASSASATWSVRGCRCCPPMRTWAATFPEQFGSGPRFRGSHGAPLRRML